MLRSETKTFDEIKIGDTARVTKTITAEEIENFAALAQDYNPTHSFMTSTGVRKADENVLAHGMWIGILLSNIFGNTLPGPGSVYKSQSLHWHKMLHLGQRITLTVEVIEKNEAEKLVTFQCQAFDQNAELVIEGEAQVITPTEKLNPLDKDIKEVQLMEKLDLFDELVERARQVDPVRVAVAYPVDKVSISGALEGRRLGFMEPILYGPKAEIEAAAKAHDLDISSCEIIDCSHEVSSARRAVLDCREGHADMLMKGSLHTDNFMGAVVARDVGLRTARRISHVFVMDVPSYHKMLMITDAAINIYPDLATKADIITNAVGLANILGIETPKVAILSAIETVSPKIESTMEAASLCKMADRGQIQGAILDGPLAFDNAISKEAALIKKIESDVCGDADILVAPNLEASNMISKQLAYLGNAEMAGVVLGAKVPIVLTSRADDARARLGSAAIAALMAADMKKNQI